MKIDLTEDEAQRLINSQRDTIARLKKKLRKINVHMKYLEGYKSPLTKQLLQTASDLFGHEATMECDSVDTDFCEKMQEFYRDLAANDPRRRLPIFSEEFLYALPLEGTTVRNILYTIKEIRQMTNPAPGEPPAPDHFSSNDEFSK